MQCFLMSCLSLIALLNVGCLAASDSQPRESEFQKSYAVAVVDFYRFLEDTEPTPTPDPEPDPDPDDSGSAGQSQKKETPKEAEPEPDFSIVLVTDPSWCSPCRWIEVNTFPSLRKAGLVVSEKSGANIKTVGDEQENLRKYKVEFIPTWILLDSKGKEVRRHSGPLSRRQFDARFPEMVTVGTQNISRQSATDGDATK